MPLEQAERPCPYGEQDLGRFHILAAFFPLRSRLDAYANWEVWGCLQGGLGMLDHSRNC